MFISAEIVAEIVRAQCDKPTAYKILRNIAVLEHDRRIQRVDSELEDEFREIALAFNQFQMNEKGLRKARLRDTELAMDGIKAVFNV